MPRLGVGAMTWGDARGLARFHPAKMAYGGAHGADEEKEALETSLAAGVTLFDTAAMYSGGASERRLGELAAGKDVLIASKFPGSLNFRTENFPQELEASLKRPGPQLDRPVPAPLSIQASGYPSVDGSAGRCSRGGQGQGGGGEQLFSRTNAHGARRACPARHSAGFQPGGVFAAAPAAGNERCTGCMPRAGNYTDRLFSTGDGHVDWKICCRCKSQRTQALYAKFQQESAAGSPSGAGSCCARSGGATPRRPARWPCAG